MAKKEFVLQGFTNRTHADAIRELLTVANVERVWLSVAFVSQSGVEQIENELKAHASKLVAFVGIRNDITSYQGLLRLYDIGGRLYTVDTGSRRILFHPKLYFVRGKSEARLVLGSANLTLGGLNNNVEAGMSFAFDLNDAKDKEVVDTIEAQLSDLATAYPANIQKVDTVAYLEELLATGRVVDGMAVSAPRPTTSADAGTTSDTTPRITLKVPFLRSADTKAPAPGKNSKPRKPTPSKPFVQPSGPIPATTGIEFEFVWESKSLTRRDLTIPTAKGTNPTGSVNLDKGLLADNIDHRHYFRDIVFPHLLWSKRGTTVDEAFAKFQLVVKGISFGDFDLALRHTHSTNTTAYNQRNAMTRLSWGPMRPFVARTNLIGRTLALYRDKADPKRFLLEID